MAKEDPPLSYDEEKTQASASETLLMQLATDPTKLAKGVNMARMGVIQDSENVPESYRNWVYWDLRAKLFGSRFAYVLHKSGLDHTVGIGGRGRVDTIKAASVATGGAVNTEADIIKPGFITRTILERDWEEKERHRLGLQAGE